jgi:hypothetical protein
MLLQVFVNSVKLLCVSEIVYSSARFKIPFDQTLVWLGEWRGIEDVFRRVGHG